ncbi:hypothetical protein G7046_g8793 [Stylonectria norvegica]|nr:hypothetical protein G7046_g8793 [Stylonectria norvegica]
MALPLEHGPVPTSLPELPSSSFFNESQWDVLNALVDAVFPCIIAESAIKDKAYQIPVADEVLKQIIEQAAKVALPSTTEETLQDFLEYRPSQDPRFVENLIRTLSHTPQDRQKALAGFLSLMATRPGSLLTTGYWQPIYKQPASIKDAILKSWVTSRTVLFRTLLKTITTLAQKANCQTNLTLPQLSGYTDIPGDWQAKPGFAYQFLQFGPDEQTQVIETDVVIVGSGCGGGVCAKNLAEGGHRVLVVDKGYYFPPSQLPMHQDAACNYLFDNGGFYLTDDNGCNISAGSVWGGGSTVNWSVCLKLQDFVRKEWADTGLPLFASKAFDQCMDRVWDFAGAGTENIRHNHRNKVLLEGSKKLGWVAHEAPQNTAGKEHFCGQCHLGCGSAEKRGAAARWLPAAAEAGAEFLEGFTVDKVVFSEDGRSAIGVEGEWVSRDAAGGVSAPEGERIRRRVIVKAKRVILSAGSLWSPLVLLKSGIKNRHIGSNLHIHPCNFVTAVYKEEVRPWEGGIITSYCPEFENLDDKGHGVKLEPTCMVPYTILSQMPWTSGLDAKLLLLKYRHLNGFISLTRDRDSGRVYPDPQTGRPRVDYVASEFDREHTLDGVQALAKLCYVTGATEIRPLFPGLEPFIVPHEPGALTNDSGNPDPEFSDPAFAAWLNRLRKVGNKPPASMWSSAHQMGTCRMSATEDAGVVDAKGKVWGTENLYVADASVFPSASGVNPMITLMAIADWISRGVNEDLRA